ncbi:hypothetical protein COCVIDRAFT_111686 [Bipolaris victoriae FI3]|uniref:Uncharacterized protein n=1 Tax=Bipolaris victoriae (strain FI3) TaxID=930091 RepID=W7DW39_BIPV3|nr:hypothetical protein COCVIDRAFT_111686 [Bipolaris victoriae FI3]
MGARPRRCRPIPSLWIVCLYAPLYIDIWFASLHNVSSFIFHARTRWRAKSPCSVAMTSPSPHVTATTGPAPLSLQAPFSHFTVTRASLEGG